MDFAKLLFAYFLVFGTTITANAECISKADMSDIATHFTQFKSLAGKEYCYDGSATSNLLQTVMFIRNTQFAPTMPVSSDELFTGAFAKDWWKYFIGRIDEMKVQQNCPKGAGAFVQPLFGKIMFVCPLILTDSFTAMDRASVFMHEARHIDGYGHITCTTGPRKGLQGACDTRISDKGSYAVTVETYVQMAKYATDLHPAVKSYAFASGIIYAEEAFEIPVKIERDYQFLLMTKNAQFHQLDMSGPTKIEKPLGLAPALGQIMMISVYHVLYPDDKNLPAQYVFANGEGSVPNSPGGAANEYNAATPTEKAKLVGLHSGAQWGARAFVDKVRVVCNATAPTTVELQYPNGAKPLAILYPNGYNREFANAHLQMDNGAILEFGCKNKNGYLQASNLKYDQIFKRLYKAGNTTLGLTYDGNLFTVANGVSTPLNTQFNGQVHELAPNHNFTFYDPSI